MCLIIHRPANVEVDEDDVLFPAAINNPDGFGMMWAKRGEIRFLRTVESLDGISAYKTAPKNVDMFLHFRLATHGLVNHENCHPFRVQEGLYLMHNGILPYTDTKGIQSDTGIFADILGAALASNPQQFYSHQFRNNIEQRVGTYNKIVFLRYDGSVWFVNKRLWSPYKGLLLSNLYSISLGNGGCEQAWDNRWIEGDAIYSPHGEVIGTLSDLKRGSRRGGNTWKEFYEQKGHTIAEDADTPKILTVREVKALPERTSIGVKDLSQESVIERARIAL